MTQTTDVDCPACDHSSAYVEDETLISRAHLAYAQDLRCASCGAIFGHTI